MHVHSDLCVSVEVVVERGWSGVVCPEKVLTCLVLIQVAASAMSNSLYPGRDVIRIVLYAGCAVSVLVLTVVLVRVQRRERRCRSEWGER